MIARYASFVFVALFCFVNGWVWGDGGYYLDYGLPVSAYSLIWFWIVCIAFHHYRAYRQPLMTKDDGSKAEDKRSLHVAIAVSAWWTANITMTQALNMFSFRGVQVGGDLVELFGYTAPSLITDFIFQAGVDLAAIFVLLLVVRRTAVAASAWMLLFAGYLVANLFGHFYGSLQLLAGESADNVAMRYDGFMYLTFTIMLFLQALGAGGSGFLSRITNVDIYSDLRRLVPGLLNRRKGLR